MSKVIQISSFLEKYQQWQEIIETEIYLYASIKKIDQVDKEDVVYIHNGILPTIKNNEIMPFAAAWMDLEGIRLSEVSQKEKNKYQMISLICGI